MSEFDDAQAYDVFISYSSKDLTTARALYEALESQGIKCWFDKMAIGGGASFYLDIPEAIDSIPTIVLIFSAVADGSKNVASEIKQAWDNDSKIIPVRIEDVMPKKLRYFLGLSQWIDAFDSPIENHSERVVNEIVKVLKKGAKLSTSPLIQTTEAAPTEIAPAAITPIEAALSPTKIATPSAPQPSAAQSTQDENAEFDALWQALREKVASDSDWMLPALSAGEFRLTFDAKNNAFGEHSTSNAAKPYTAPKKTVQEVWRGLKPDQEPSNSVIRGILNRGSHTNLIGAVIEELRRIEAARASGTRPEFETVWQKFVVKAQSAQPPLVLSSGSGQYQVSISPRGSALGVNLNGNAATTYTASRPTMEQVWNELKPNVVATSGVVQEILGKGAHYSFIGAVIEEMRRL